MHARDIDIERLVSLTSDYTPADMLGAAQQAAFAGFTRATSAATADPLSTDDFLRALNVTVPSLDAELIAEFERTVVRYSRT